MKKAANGDKIWFKGAFRCKYYVGQNFRSHSEGSSIYIKKFSSELERKLYAL